MWLTADIMEIAYKAVFTYNWSADLYEEMGSSCMPYDGESVVDHFMRHEVERSLSLWGEAYAHVSSYKARDEVLRSLEDNEPKTGKTVEPGQIRPDIRGIQRDLT